MSGASKNIYMGFERFRNAVSDGTSDPELNMLVAYAQYLSNGGTPDGWDTLTNTDITVMMTYMRETRLREMEAQAILNAKYIAKLFGGKE